VIFRHKYARKSKDKWGKGSQRLHRPVADWISPFIVKSKRWKIPICVRANPKIGICRMTSFNCSWKKRGKVCTNINWISIGFALEWSKSLKRKVAFVKPSEVREITITNLSQKSKRNIRHNWKNCKKNMRLKSKVF
jgi:hypothetical protein